MTATQFTLPLSDLKREWIAVDCSANGHEWVEFPLYMRCRVCGVIQEDPHGWQRLVELQRELKRKRE